MFTVDLVLGLVSFLLTLLVLSYILAGDNPFFRVATYTFIGVAAAYVALVVFEQVLAPRLLIPLASGTLNGLPLTLNDRVLLVVPLLLSLLLFTKLSPGLARLGNVSMAYLVGTGAALTVGGAVLGTLFTQSLATINLFDQQTLAAGGVLQPALLLDAGFVLLGTVATLFYFYFGARPRPNGPPRRSPLIEGAARVGQVFIAITFGSLFAGVYIAALTALVERINYLLNFNL
jgi:hypothetical protein